MIEKQDIIFHPRNKRILFDSDQHTYTFDGSTKFNGITGLIHKFGKPFESEKIANFIAKRDGISVQEVYDLWNKLREYGNIVHESIELYVTQGKLRDIPEVHNFIANMEKYELTPLHSEWVLYDEKVKLASPVDIICRNKNNELVVIDTKTMKNGVRFTPYQKNQMLGYPIHNLPDTQYMKYSVQVGFYTKWISELYDFPIAKTHYILHIHGDQSSMIPVINLEDEVESLINFVEENEISLS